MLRKVYLPNDNIESLQFIEIGCSTNLAGAVTLASNEVIVEADVDIDTKASGYLLVAGLTFRTSLDREFGPYGWVPGNMYTSRGRRLNGFRIGVGNIIHTIGFVLQCDTGP